MTPFDPYAYLEAVAAALDLPIPAERRDAVAANLRRLHAMAEEVMAFEVPAEPPAGPAPP